VAGNLTLTRPLSLTISDTAPRRNRVESSWIIPAGNTRRNSRFRAFIAKLVCGASHVETLAFSQPWSTLADFSRRIGESWHVVWGYIAKNDPERRVLQNRHGACGDTRNLGHQALVRHGKWKNSAAGEYPPFLCDSMGTQIPDLFNGIVT